MCVALLHTKCTLARKELYQFGNVDGTERKSIPFYMKQKGSQTE